MIKPPSSLQDLAKSNDGAPGIDGVTFEAIEESGVESFLKQIQDELVHNTYQPMRVRKKEIPKDGVPRSAFFPFPPFVTVWSRGHSSSSWSQSSKLIFNRGRTDTDRSGQLRRRCSEWTKRSWQGRHASLILICEPTSRTRRLSGQRCSAAENSCHGCCAGRWRTGSPRSRKSSPSPRTCASRRMTRRIPPAPHQSGESRVLRSAFHHGDVWNCFVGRRACRRCHSG